MCYLVPTAAAITTGFIWKGKRSLELGWLFLLFLGGSLFGIVDHLWNRELFLVSENWLKDLALGAVITAAITLAWGMICRVASPRVAAVK